jgi:hypothetical protein
MRTSGTPKASVLAVADGVGAYAESGMDARLPCVLLERAYREMVASGVLVASTALILSLADNVLELPYIGDIAFFVLHESKIMFLSPAAAALFPHHTKEASLLLHCRPTETTSLVL